MIRIISGLEKGEKVLLTLPLSSASAEQFKPLESADIPEKKVIKPETTPAPEQMQDMRKKYENLSDEEKKKMREKMKQQGGQRKKGGKRNDR